MLIEFRVENHRSILSEQVITFEAGRGGERGDSPARSVGKRRLLPVAALYGANGSGKSNLLSALAYMARAVTGPASWASATATQPAPFAWADGPRQPSLFEATFARKGFEVQVGFVVGEQGVIEEWIHAWPKGRKQVWLAREAGAFRFGSRLKGATAKLASLTGARSLFLAVAAHHGHEQLGPIAEMFSEIRVVGGALGADAAIADVDGPALGPLAQVIPAVHPELVNELRLPLRERSSGGQALARLLPAIATTLEAGGLLIADDLTANLHPRLGRRIVEVFNDPQSNLHNAQLLCATHDTSLIGTAVGEPVLRRDQVWFADKDHAGETKLYPLTDYTPRGSENVERSYLQGRYGATPILPSSAGE